MYCEFKTAENSRSFTNLTSSSKAWTKQDSTGVLLVIYTASDSEAGSQLSIDLDLTSNSNKYEVVLHLALLSELVDGNLKNS